MKKKALIILLLTLPLVFAGCQKTRKKVYVKLLEGPVSVEGKDTEIAEFKTKDLDKNEFILLWFLERNPPYKAGDTLEVKISDDVHSTKRRYYKKMIIQDGKTREYTKGKVWKVLKATAIEAEKAEKTELPAKTIRPKGELK